MQYTTLGRTGLNVSVAGLGCGGHSRLGQKTGKTEQESISVVRHALDLGINLIDTAEAYGTERIVGKAIQDVGRDRVVISTKKLCPAPEGDDPVGELRRGVEHSLKRLQTDYVDVFYLHGVRAGHYQYARDTLLPGLLQMQEQGKVRFVGVTEAFIPDPQHAMAEQALQDDCWDVMMIGFNFLNQSARQRVFPQTQAKNIGTMGMFAVRNALSRPTHLKKILTELRDKNQIDPTLCEMPDVLGFLTDSGKAETLPEAAYRYCRHDPGLDSVLTGTGNIEHLKENDEVCEFTIDLWATSNVFKAGHCIRLDIASSNFPRFDRNPQTGEASGEASRLEPALQRVFHDEAHPSHVVLPIIPR